MKSKVLWCLAGANIALGLMYVMPHLQQNAAAAQRVERPSDYVMIPGSISGSDRGVVYIIDTSNGMMSAVAYDDSSGTIEVMAPTDLIRTFEEGPNINRRSRNR